MWRESMEQALGIKDKHPLEDQLNYLETVVVPNNQVFLAIDEAAKKVVGFMALTDTELNQLYLHINYQGQGLGTRFLEMAKQLSPQKLQLYTFAVNEKAQRFYERHGFQIIGRGFEPDLGLDDIRYEWMG